MQFSSTLSYCFKHWEGPLHNKSLNYKILCRNLQVLKPAEVKEDKEIGILNCSTKIKQNTNVDQKEVFAPICDPKVSADWYLHPWHPPKWIAAARAISKPVVWHNKLGKGGSKRKEWKSDRARTKFLKHRIEAKLNLRFYTICASLPLFIMLFSFIKCLVIAFYLQRKNKKL